MQPDRNENQAISPPKWKRKRYWFGGFILCCIGLVLWLSGPGLRWLGPIATKHFLNKAGLDADFQINGNLVGGISISDLKLKGAREIKSLTIGKATPGYQFGNLLKGQLDSLTIDGLHAELRLGLEKPAEPEKPFDLDAIIQSLRLARAKVLPVKLDLQDISVTATKDDKPVIAVASSSLAHAAGSEDFLLELGAITDANNSEWPAQESEIAWKPEALTVDKIQPLPGISIQNLSFQMPLDAGPSLETLVRMDDAVLVLVTEPGFSQAKVDLREGKIEIAKILERLGSEIPAAATLTSLSIELTNLMPDPAAASGSARLLFENVEWQDWSLSEFNLDATLGSQQLALDARGLAPGTEISLAAKAPVDRSGDAIQLGKTNGQFKVSDIPKLVAALAERYPAINGEAPVPASTFEGDFEIAFNENLPVSANLSAGLQPVEAKTATALNLKGRWEIDQPVSGEITVDGLKANGLYQIEEKTYQANIEFAEFSTARIAPWLAIGKIELGGVGRLDGSWAGSGAISPARHRGEFALTKGEWEREAAPLITGIGALRYDWPGMVEASGFRVQMNDQVLALEANLKDEALILKRFSWDRGKEQIAEGTATLPVPKDFSKWREMLATDPRALEVSIQSKVLSLALIKEWVPAAEKLDPRSTGQLNINVSGTYAEPEIDALFTAKDLRSLEQPNLPPTDLIVTLKGVDNNLVVTATATAPDFPPAEMKAVMPFRPADWAENPALIKEEPLDVRLDLPRLDLTRFASLVPDAVKIRGFLTGNAVASGKVGKPEMKGQINLTEGGVEFENERLANIENINAQVDLLVDKVTLTSLKSTMAGGTLDAGGSLAITEGKLANLDFRVRGDHLPVLRNDMLIVRSNLDLTLRGPFQTAVLAGTVGVVDSVFFREIELLPIGTPFNSPSGAALPKIDVAKQKTSTIPEPFRNWGLNVTLRTQDPILIRGNLARGEVNGSMKVGGTIGTPRPDGQFLVKDFRASLPFSTLKIPSGEINFRPEAGLDPILEIRGTAEPRPYQVTIYAYGRLSDPQLVLTSNPPLPDNEIMTLLATGTTTSGLEDPQVASSRAIQLLAEELRRGRFIFGKQLRPVLGLLDRVDFSVAETDPYSDASFSTATVALTDRWYVAAGLDSEGDSRAMVIWRLSFR